MPENVAIKAARYLITRNSVAPSHADPIALATRLAVSSFALLANYVAAEEECKRVHVERDRLFQAAVNEEQTAEALDDNPVREDSESDAVAHVMEWMMTFDISYAEATKALAEHDRQSEN